MDKERINLKMTLQPSFSLVVEKGIFIFYDHN